MSVDVRSAPLLPALGTWLRRGISEPRLRYGAARIPTSKQLLVDVSVIVSGDAGTGIQRVVRALLGQLKALEGEDFTVKPIYAARHHRYCYTDPELDSLDTSADQRNGALYPAIVREGDVFLGLDLAAHLIPHLERDLERWRAQGVDLNFLVYDLLPVLRPDWFPPKTPANIDRWLHVLARQADRCICISETVATDLAAALEARSNDRIPNITSIPLGWDLSASCPSRGLPANVEKIRAWLGQHTTILAVGTVEPRKGYDQLLEAMTCLWSRQPASNAGLLVIGRRGWKTEALQNRLRTHPEHGKRLLWLDDVSDELLAEIYQRVAGLVATSHGEGFGLPLIEAFAHGLPVIARDLPVFREIGGDHFDYFHDDSPNALCHSLAAWLGAPKRPPLNIASDLPRWSDTALALTNTLGLRRLAGGIAQP